MELSTKIGTRTLKNPVGVASGTFGYGEEYEELCNLENIGAIYTKAISLEPRRGNPTPRICETPSGMLNAIGLANVGLDRFISEKLPWLEDLASKNTAIVPNVSGSTEEDYCEVIRRLEGIDTVWGYEINLSCPNVKHGALAFGTDPEMVESITAKMRGITEKPLIIKLSPNVTDICSIAKAAENGGADAVSCINTLIGMVIDPAKQSIVLTNKTGGLSGPAIRPVGVAATYKVSRTVDIPVIGIGGIATADDALQYLLAGAQAFQIGTQNFIEPDIAGLIGSDIEKYMKDRAVNSIKELNSILD